MDQIDRSILSFLQTDGRTPFTEIAQALDVSEGTVRNRVWRLIEDGTVQIVGLVDPVRCGYEAAGLVNVAVQGSDVESIAAEIARLPEVSCVAIVSGKYELMMSVVCRDQEHLASFVDKQLRKMPGVRHAKLFVVLKTLKMPYGFQPALSMETEMEV